MLILVGAVFVPLFSLVDFIYYPEFWHKFLTCRLIISAVYFSLFILGRASRAGRWIIYAGLGAYYILGVCIIWMIISVDALGTPYYAGLTLVFVGFCSLIPFGARRLILHVALLYLLYLVMVLYAGTYENFRLFLVQNIFMISSTVIILVAAQNNFNVRVREYRLRKERDRAREKLQIYARLLENRVAESEAKYATVVNNADEAIFVLEDDRISFPNPRTGVLLGADRNRLNRYDFVHFVEPEDRRKVSEAYAVADEGHESTILDTIRLTRQDGTVLAVTITVVPVAWRGTKAMLHFVRDITERRKLEAELLQAQKMEAVGTLAGGISHDINNVLQIITGYCQILEARESCRRGDRKYLENIRKAAKRAANITSQLLLYSRKVDSRQEPMDVNRHIVSVCGLLERTIPRMISIDLHLQGDLHPIKADAVQFEQVIMNLAVNARDAMPDGGMLRIETRNVEVDDEISRQHGGIIPGTYVNVDVSDNGSGMTEETLSRIFDPFFTTKQEGEGTGLGLAIVYGIIKKHEGWISCTSAPGAGTSFSIFLPVFAGEDHLAEKIPASLGPHELAGCQETILVVDDEEGILEIEKDMLVTQNYQVYTALSGEEALEIFSTRSGEMDLVILDINMPGMGGYQCLVELKTIRPDLKVLIATGYAGDSQVKKVIQAGVADIIQKPFRMEDILPKIREILSGNIRP